MLVNEVKNYIEQHGMIKNGDRIVVGISGGADSVCLLKLLCEMKKYYDIDLLAVHIHHGIREGEADRDMNFTISLCDRLGVECRVYKYNIPELSKERSTTEEETGRDVRYETFRQVMKDEGYNKIAVAHNLGDNCETILFNMCRGSELKGIGGILPVRNDIIRPLLNTDRCEIEEYLEKSGIEYIVDSTNLTNDYGRNKIRNVVIPYLEKNINLRTSEHIVNAGMAALEAEEYLEYQTDIAMDKYVTGENRIIISDKITSEHSIIIKRVIREVIKLKAGKLKDITNVHIRNVEALFKREVSKSISLPYNLVALRTYDGVVIKNDEIVEYEKVDFVPCEGKVYDILGEMTLEIKVYSIEKGKNFKEIQEKMYTKCFDYDKIKDTLRIRNRLVGDYLVVDDKGSRKKIKDYFINEKIPKEDRDRIILVADGNHIIWVIGRRISEYYKVSDATTRIIQINVNLI
ncbi:MAG: tRNA lysidine(34) synthetase TilS [Lachnospiraceae bacterium]|nr:tRNA lysidine(34) synthetase TilS [Lachnospiraceae bacterium]